MLDVARAAVLLVAVGCALRHRFVVGAVFGCAIACVLAWSFAATYAAVAHGRVGGEYGFALVYFGPTMVPLGPRSFWQWSPVAVQAILAILAAVPAARALREPTNPVTTPFLGVFVPNAVMAVVTGLAAFLMWHQQASFPEYWSDHL